MTLSSLLPLVLRRALRLLRFSWPTKKILVPAAAIAVLGLVAITALAPPRLPTGDEQLAAYIAANAQRLTVPENAEVAVVARDAYSATPGIQTLAAGGTNYDWAKLVLVSGGWPMTETNVTVVLRWMRQENGPDNWWNRNNPLNNGWGSGGGGGTGSYSGLVLAAQMAAEALHRNPGYGGIVAALGSSAPTEVIEQAIWASPWASGHYANGGHWSYKPVPVVKAPDGSW